MKKVTLSLFVIMIIVILVITSFWINKDDEYSEEGSITVYFCPRDDCETVLVGFLNSAQESIHCALFEIGLESVQNMLREKSQQVEVKVVTDDQYYDQFPEPFVKKDRFGLMHNKFCVVDSKKITTGSMNPTKNGVSKNNNNLLILDQPGVVANFEAEFQELWKGEFKRGDKVNQQNAVETYFCPDDDCALIVKNELKKAKTSIYFMVFSFTHEEIANILLLKYLNGIDVKGVMEARQISKHSQFERLRYNGIDVVKDNNPSNMHHKVFIVDDTVITGSFNPTNGGDYRNDENFVVIRNKEIAELFKQEFLMLRSKVN